MEFVTRWRAKAAQMTDCPSERDQVRIVVQNLEHDMLQKLIVAPLFTFKTLHELGVQIDSAFNIGIIPRASEPIRRVFSGNTNASSNTIPKPTEINTVVATPKIADLLANTNPQIISSTRAQGRTFAPCI